MTGTRRRVARLLVATIPLFALAHVGVAHADPTMTECLEANESAIKLREGGKLLQARERTLVCALPSCPTEVREACQGRAERLAAAIPTLVVEAKDASGNDIRDVAVSLDGQPFAARLDGSALAVDPGEHTLTTSAPGHAAVDKRIVVQPGEVGRHERVDVGPELSAPPPPPPPSPGLGTRRIAAIVVGSAGVVAIGVGAGLGAAAGSAWSSVTSACGAGGPASCTTSQPASVTSNHNTAVTDGTISTVGFVAGGALLATGVVLFLTGGHASSGSGTGLTLVPSIARGGGGLGIMGTF